MPITAGAIFNTTFFTAVSTPLPKYLDPPSRSSAASNAPVDAPLGTAARPILLSSNLTSTSTVGFPRESKISLAVTELITDTNLP